jgi:cytochrome c oxidase subunit 2
MENKLIILLVIILGAIAIAQLVRVYELSAKMRKSGEHEVNSRDNHLNGKMMLGFMFFQFLGFIYLMFKYGWTGRGVAASVQGQETDWLLNLNFVIIIIMFFFTNFLLFYFTFKYVKKPGVQAFYYPHNNKLELIWTVVPAVVLAVIIILGLKSWNNLTSMSGHDAEKVELFSEQFKWTARYSGTDNVLGKYDYKLTTSSNPLAIITSGAIDSSIALMLEGSVSVKGIKQIEKILNKRDTVLSDSATASLKVDLSRKERLLRLLVQMKNNHSKKLDKYAMDDVIFEDSLVLCKNREYEFNFRSKDVIHSAYFLHFRAQINTVPGMTTRTKFKPIYTTEEMRKIEKNPSFNYILMCNKICGGAHYGMKMKIYVASEDEYKKWQKKVLDKSFKSRFLGSNKTSSISAISDSIVKVNN